ncbi:MAG: glycosyltransferase [Candidatus Cloacimonetes bacterium]|nr:glycosyltransferase [Candidatus Cloacimonadota bacterium]
MAVYNGEKYLRLAIDSVLQQSFTDYEFIIVDDCSTDSTPAIISSYRYGRIKYIRNKVNLGQTPSLNIALNFSKGKYITRIDADDIYLPEKLEKQYWFMEEHTEIAVSGTFGIRIDDDGKTLAVLSKTEDIYFKIFYGSPLIHVSVIMRRSVILKNGGYNEKYLYCADFALWSKLIRNNYHIANLPEPLVKFREYGNSIGNVNKLGSSSEEASEIIFTNITNLLKISVSKEECKDIVLMKWPSSGTDIFGLLNAYLNLIQIAKEVDNNKIRMTTFIYLIKYLLKCLLKRGFYYKYNRHVELIFKDLLIVFRFYFNHPLIILSLIISFLLVLTINKKKMRRIKLLFSN